MKVLVSWTKNSYLFFSIDVKFYTFNNLLGDIYVLRSISGFKFVLITFCYESSSDSSDYLFSEYESSSIDYSSVGNVFSFLLLFTTPLAKWWGDDPNPPFPL